MTKYGYQSPTGCMIVASSDMVMAKTGLRHFGETGDEPEWNDTFEDGTEPEQIVNWPHHSRIMMMVDIAIKELAVSLVALESQISDVACARRRIRAAIDHLMPFTKAPEELWQDSEGEDWPLSECTKVEVDDDGFPLHPEPEADPLPAAVMEVTNNGYLRWCYRHQDGAMSFFATRTEAYTAFYDAEGWPAEQPEDEPPLDTPSLDDSFHRHEMEMDCDDRRIGPTDDDTVDSKGEKMLSRFNEAGERRW